MAITVRGGPSYIQRAALASRRLRGGSGGALARAKTVERPLDQGLKRIGVLLHRRDQAADTVLFVHDAPLPHKLPQCGQRLGGGNAGSGHERSGCAFGMRARGSPAEGYRSLLAETWGGGGVEQRCSTVRGLAAPFSRSSAAAPGAAPDRPSRRPACKGSHHRGRCFRHAARSLRRSWERSRSLSQGSGASAASVHAGGAACLLCRGPKLLRRGRRL